jgi:hypothetical protein
MEPTTEALYGLPLTLQISEVLKEHLPANNKGLTINQIANLLIENNPSLCIDKREKYLLKKRIKNFVKSMNKAGLLHFTYYENELANKYLIVTKFNS